MQRGYEYAQAQYDNAEPEESPRVTCSECGEDIYDELTTWDGEPICEDCLDKHWKEMTFSEKAQLFGGTIETVESWIEAMKEART